MRTRTSQDSRNVEFMKDLVDSGYGDALILEPETVHDVLTEKRRELLETIKNGEVEGVRDLARIVERNESNVHQDLTVLFEAGLIEFEAKGNRKVPVLAHENVFVKPIL